LILKVLAFISSESACVQPFVRPRGDHAGLWCVMLLQRPLNGHVLHVFEQSSVRAWRAPFVKLRCVLLDGEPSSLHAGGVQMVFYPIGCASRRVGHFVEFVLTLFLFQALSVSRQNGVLSTIR
jgi:hypothetical protein